ncbi:hypothetical protein NHQ30_009188 [Ciborinia camelliae]|nr:hypothetical protein NHQ30_009188 [Ciborinia camelliae]
MAAHHLKIPFLDPPRPITLLGGLTSFGGAGNNYSLHAITEMTRQLRAMRSQTDTLKDKRRSNGLILANGGVFTYQHVICLSTQSRSDGEKYQDGNPCSDIVPSSLLRRSIDTSSDTSSDTLPECLGSDGDVDVDVVGEEGVGNGVWEGIIEVSYLLNLQEEKAPVLNP